MTTAAKWNVRHFEQADLDAVMAIQGNCPQASQWLRSDYNRVATGSWGVACWIAADAARISGFLAAQVTSGEIEILNLAVSPDARRAGIGSLLLDAAISGALKFGARAAFLELRDSNAGALAFYLACGFHLAGRRCSYYSSPPEDALLLRRDL